MMLLYTPTPDGSEKHPVTARFFGALKFKFGDGERATYLSEGSRFNEVVHELHTQSLTVVDHLSLWGEGENMRE